MKQGKRKIALALCLFVCVVSIVGCVNYPISDVSNPHNSSNATNNTQSSSNANDKDDENKKSGDGKTDNNNNNGNKNTSITDSNIYTDEYIDEYFTVEMPEYEESEEESIASGALNSLFNSIQGSSRKMMTATVTAEAYDAAPAMEAAAADEAYYDGGYDDAYIEYSNTNMSVFDTSEFNPIDEHGFTDVALEPLSTFAADTDTGSYTYLRRAIAERYDEDFKERYSDSFWGWNDDAIIDGNSLRVEEFLNYFDWDTKNGKTDDAFKVDYEIADSDWSDNKILFAKIQTVAESKSTCNNFVFLMDTSGSMAQSDKIDMSCKGFGYLVASLSENDIVSIVTYSGSSETVIESCKCDEKGKEKIFEALKQVQQQCWFYGGGTNGEGGIKAAYELADKNFIEGGNNRVILSSDGDMNIGVSTQSGLVDLIESYKNDGIYLTTLGFGTGNFSDANMEQIANHGNGNYFYIDCLNEAKRVLCDKLKENTDVVAKDAKFQIEFNPSKVKKYRQIGYENRQMAASDFANDEKDGGELGANRQIIIMYELIMGEADTAGLKYQTAISNGSDEIATISIRYQKPEFRNLDKKESKLLEFPIENKNDEMSEDMSFAQGIVESVMLFRNSENIGNASIDTAISLLKNGTMNDKYRSQFLWIMETVKKENAIAAK